MKNKSSLPGLKINHCKNTEDYKTEIMIPPQLVYISMRQHIGVPCEPLVEIGEKVEVGQPIGKANSFFSAPIHASVSGTIEDIKGVRSYAGGEDKTIVIKNDRKKTPWRELKKPEVTSTKEFIEGVEKSGAVGLGGAAFPTHIKLNPKNLEDIDTLIINGAECEPYITSDYRTMLEDGEDVLLGISLITKYLNIKKVYIGIENNKPKGILALEELIKEKELNEKIEVISLKSTYPKGAERVLVQEITGKELRAGVLPAELGMIVLNITTTAFIGNYFRTGMPLVSRRITVDGSAVRTPKNVVVPIGTKIEDVIKFCDGYRCPPGKIIMGGTMMGRAIFSDSLSIIKNNNAILAFNSLDAEKPLESECINCGRCCLVCPVKLMPFALNKAYEAKNIERLEELNVMECMECGSCSYVCPARLPLGFINKLGKDIVKEGKNK